ncbi:hypothetical protein D3C75_1245510 [compost metagenome]
MGELQGVAQQVDQHLTQAQRVEPVHPLRLAGQLQAQVQPLTEGLGVELLDNGVEEWLERPRLRFQLQAAGLDAGKIEAVTDQGDQLAG